MLATSLSMGKTIVIGYSTSATYIENHCDNIRLLSQSVLKDCACAL